MKTMKLFPLTFVAALMCWVGIARADTPANIGAGSFTNAVLILDNASVEDMRTEAYYRATHDQFRVRSTTQGDTRVIEGVYTVTDGDKIFFVHSDDGATVTCWELDEQGAPIEGTERVLIMGAGQPQDGTNLDSSLWQLPFVFKQGKKYKFKIDYSNTIHKDPQLVNGQLVVDSDGVSVFVLPSSALPPSAQRPPIREARVIPPPRGIFTVIGMGVGFVLGGGLSLLEDIPTFGAGVIANPLTIAGSTALGGGIGALIDSALGTVAGGGADASFMGGTARDAEQRAFNSVCDKYNIRGDLRNQFSEYFHQIKRLEERSPSDNFSYQRLKELAVEFLEGRGN